MSYSIDLGGWSGIFAVPCDLVDKHLRLAGPAHIKVILYILRHSGKTVELSELAALCGLSEGDTADAVRYWQQEGLIAVCGESISPPIDRQSVLPARNDNSITLEEDIVTASASLRISPESCSHPIPVSASDETAAEDNVTPKAKEHIRYSYNECSEMMKADAELRQMLNTLEEILSKQLNSTERSVFITLYKWYGLPPACIAMLVEYCREIGKPSAAYIETTGIGWVKEEINTVDRVVDKISRLRASRSAWVHIKRLLDIPDRAPTKKEQEYCSLWVNEWHICDELIMLAYERCVDSKGKMSMSYMNGIISKWQKNGIFTAEQALSDSAPGCPASASATGMYQATYEKDDVESVLDDDWMDDVET